MKLRFVSVLALAGLILSLSFVFRKADGHESVRRAGSQATCLYKWLTAWASEEGGRFPADLQELSRKALGWDSKENLEAAISNVIEYRGAGLKVTDDPNLLLLRYRGDDGIEARVRVSGAASAFRASTPDK